MDYHQKAAKALSYETQHPAKVQMIKGKTEKPKKTKQMLVTEFHGKN